MLPVTVLSGLRPRPGLGWLVPVQPVVHPATDLLVLRSIACLQRTEKLVVVAFDRHHIVIGQLAPLFLEFSFQLFPLSFELLAIHSNPPWLKIHVLRSIDPTVERARTRSSRDGRLASEKGTRVLQRDVGVL